MVIPKGTALDGISQWELAGVFSHANSLCRAALFGASPLALAMRVLPQGLLDQLGLVLIAPDDVLLKPSLLVALKATMADRAQA